MLKDGTWSRAFIRVSILLLRSVTPLSTTYCVARVIGWQPRLPYGLWRVLDIYATAEAAFYFVVYLPRCWLLNRPAPRLTPILHREQRRALFARTWNSTPDPRGYLSLWFKGIPIEELHREDVKDWISWRMWNTLERSNSGEDELNEYLSQLESILDWKFPEGRSGNSSMAVTFEPLPILHRPLIWYTLFVGGADLQMCAMMLYYGFQFQRNSLRQIYTTLPLRLWSILAFRRSPSSHVPYWHIQHKSTDHVPILFIHGIGVGLHFYLNFFKDFLRELRPRGVGMIALELLPISSRVTAPFLQEKQTVEEIRRILQKHGWTRCVVMSHSYGSVVAAHMLHDSSLEKMVGPMLFVDPVSFSFHPPEVAWNFLRRRPTTASEIQLHYFASTDPDVAYTLTQRFIWTENSLWREDVEDRAKLADGYDRRCTVTLAGRDIITNTNTLGCYLTRRHVGDSQWYDESDALNDDWKSSRWTGEKPLEVIWFPDLNHAETFDDTRDRQTLIQVLQKYSSNSGTTGRVADEAI